MRPNSKITIYNEEQSFGTSQRSGFSISKYSDKQDENLNRIESHRHTYFEIIFVLKGSGVHTIDFTEYKFKGPCLFLLHPQNIHTVQKDFATTGGVIKFTNDFFSFDNQGDFLDNYRVFDDVDVLPVLNLTISESKQIENIFSVLHEEYYSVSPFSNAITVSLLKVFLIKVFEIKKKSAPQEIVLNSDFLRFQKFNKQLESMFQKQHKVSFYATLLTISTKTLSNLCTQITGKTAGILIKERIVLEAKRQLRFSTLSAKEIAHNLGFEDEAYFIRFFTKNTGNTPIRFRKNNSIS